MRWQGIMETVWIVGSCFSFCQPNQKISIYMTRISTSQISRPKPLWKFSSTHSYLLPLQETIGMLQTQLREAHWELEHAAQQHRDGLVALQEDHNILLLDKTDLQKQVHPSPTQPHSPSPA